MKFLLFLKYLRKAFRQYLKYGSKDFVFVGLNRAKVHVLGNGPSLSKSLHLIERGDDLAVVNYFILSDFFLELKPRYYCLADPVFFHDTDNEDMERKKMAVIERLKMVDWNLTIVTPARFNTSCFENLSSSISFRSVNSIPLDAAVRLMRWTLYKRNFSMPTLQNVIVLAIYISLQKGYKNIYLHGVDSDSYKNICINPQNEMVTTDFHYYGSSNRNLSDLKWAGFSKGSLYKRLECEVTMFRSYVDLAAYADYLGAQVINASPNSMIDAFERYDHDEKVKRVI